MSNAPYAQRAINCSFQLGKGSFGGSGFNTVTLENLRIETRVEYANLPHAPTAIVRIYGMTLSQMNELTVAGLQWQNRNNKVLVEAGDFGSKLTAVFNGDIIEAYPDFKDMPNAAFVVLAVGGAGINLTPVSPTSFKGSVSVETALNQICGKAGLTLENNGVDAQLSNPYFPGTATPQINSAIRAANCFGHLDTINSTLSIWPRGGSRSGETPTISAATGMIGYPEFEKNMIKVRTLFDPEIKGVGKKIKVESQLTAAQGEWTVIQIDYNLASQMLNGPWEMTIKAYSQSAGP